MQRLRLLGSIAGLIAALGFGLATVSAPGIHLIGQRLTNAATMS